MLSKSYYRAFILSLGVIPVAAGSIMALTMFPKPPPEDPTEVVVFGYNDLGMHCMNDDFSELLILPPYNTLHAQVVDRSEGDPHILKENLTVKYSIPGNTHSADKTNFWKHAEALFGVTFATGYRTDRKWHVGPNVSNRER